MTDTTETTSDDITVVSDEEAAAESSSTTPRPSRWPKIIVAITTVLAILASLSVWARTQLLDTDEWVNLSSELLQEEEVQQALSVYVVDALYADGAVTQALGDQLPADVQGLAGPVAGAIRGPITDGVQELLGSQQVRLVWETVNRLAHERLVAVLKGETVSGLETAGGEVALELRPLVVDVGQRVGVSQERLDEIPADAGRIVVFESDELDNVQQAVEIAEFTAWFLFVLVVALYVLAVYLARGRRIEMLRSVGWSLVVVGIVILAARAIAVRTLVDLIVANPGNRPVAESAGTVATALLGQMGWSLVIYGALIVLFTALMGDHRWAQATRRLVAPALNASTGAVVGGTAVLLLLLFWWSPGRAFEGVTTTLVLVGLVIGAVVTLRRKTLEEFPDDTVETVTESLVGAE